MRGRCLDRAHGDPLADEFLVVREPHLANGYAKSDEHALRLDQGRDDLPVDPVSRIASVYADPQAANSIAD